MISSVSPLSLTANDGDMRKGIHLDIHSKAERTEVSE